MRLAFPDQQLDKPNNRSHFCWPVMSIAAVVVLAFLRHCRKHIFVIDPLDNYRPTY